MEPPRGLSDHNMGAALATARWGDRQDLAPFGYEPGDIFLGTVEAPSPDARSALAEIASFRQMLEVLQVEPVEGPAWKAAQIGTLDDHAAHLERSATFSIGVRDDRHMVTVAGTRSGKGTSAIIPALCTYPGSILVIDPKGENARRTVARRGAGGPHCKGMGQTTIVLDPYNTTGLPKDVQGRWNPLDLLQADDVEMVDKASSIAEALVIRAKSEDAHFDESAIAFIKALTLFVAVTHAGRPTRNLLTVYDLLMRGMPEELDPNRPDPNLSDAFMMLLIRMMEVPTLDGVIAGAAAALNDMSDRERGSVLSTARRNMAFLERPLMRAVLKESSFDLDRIKTAPEGTTLFLCLPQQRMEDCGRFLRLMINATLERIYAIEGEPQTGHPILFLLEEFASLKHMASIESAAGYAAGFGVKLWVIIQDLAQLKRQYHEGFETFLGNAGIIQAFGNSDATTLDYLSKKLGQVEVTQTINSLTTSKTASTNDPGEGQRVQSLIQNRGALSLLNPLAAVFDEGGTGESATTTSAQNEQVQRTSLMLPDEIERFFRREALNQLVSIKGLRPFILDRVLYYDSPLFEGLYTLTEDEKAKIADSLAARRAAEAKRSADAKQRITEALAFVRNSRRNLEAAMSKKR